MAQQGMKPYVKLASTLVVLGTSAFTLERFGLGRLEGSTHAVHINGIILSLLILVPIGLVFVGAAVFVVGKMRRL